MENTKIPARLKNVHFCRVKKNTKIPFEKSWNKKPYSYNEIQKYFPQENFGIICGGHNNLAVIDCDNDKLTKIIQKRLPQTLSVKTGKGGKHFYYFIPELKKKLILNDEINHLGEVQFTGAQVVGPGSIYELTKKEKKEFPNANGKYEIVDNTEIQEISLEKLMEAVEPFIKKEKENNYVKIKSALNSEDEIDKLKVLDIWGAIKLKQHGKELYGSHPIHGSKGGSNFWINPERNTWHCFRCDSGGGALSAIAVKEGIIDCADAVPGGLRDNKAKEAIRVAKEKYGLKEKQNYSYQEPPPVEAYEEEYTPQMEERKKKTTLVDNTHHFADILKMTPNPEPWILDKMIEENELNSITAKTGIGKSLVMLKMMIDISNGNNFLNEFETKKKKVIIYDLEMSRDENIRRVQDLQEGLPDIDIMYKANIDIEKDYDEIKEHITENKYELAIFDPLALLIPKGKKEKEGDDMKDIMILFKKLIWETGITVVFLHHHGKNDSYTGTDLARNATQITDYCASHIILKKINDISDMGEIIGSKIELSQGKGRGKKRFSPFVIKIIGREGKKTIFTYIKSDASADEKTRWVNCLTKEMEINKGYTKKEMVEIITDKLKLKNIKTEEGRFTRALDLFLQDERHFVMRYSEWLTEKNLHIFEDTNNGGGETAKNSNIYYRKEYKETEV